METDTVARLPQAPVCPAPSACFRISCFLLQEVMPVSAPQIKCISERRFVGLGQSAHEMQEFDTCFELWIQSEIPDDNLFLVEVTHLDWDAWKKPVQSYEPAINDEC